MRITDSKRSKGGSPLSELGIDALHASEALSGIDRSSGGTSTVERYPNERSTGTAKVTDRRTVFGARSPGEVAHR